MDVNVANKQEKIKENAVSMQNKNTVLRINIKYTVTDNSIKNSYTFRKQVYTRLLGRVL
jgi:hypothetical protein